MDREELLIDLREAEAKLTFALEEAENGHCPRWPVYTARSFIRRAIETAEEPTP